VRRTASWRAADAPPTGRHALYKELWRELLETSPANRDRLVDRVRGWSGVRAGARMLYTPLSIEQAHELASSTLFEVGAHSVTHARLPGLTRVEQAEEIAGSRRALQAITGKPVDHFAYPFGMYGPESRELAREAGYASAMTVDPGSVSADTDPYAVPRVVVGDWEADRLLETLSAWLPSSRD
jgi:peptidoglycan/xylan/chitin deacetylase (PgdA/CDA1 family)